MTQFCIHPKLLQSLREFAIEHNTSVSQVIRVAVLNYLDKSLKSPVFQTTFIPRNLKAESNQNVFGAK